MDDTLNILDLAAGYRQVQMDKDSQEKTAFNTYSKHCEFLVMPFGLCNVSSTFQRLVETVLVVLTRSCYLVYLDDVMVIRKFF